MFERLKSKLRLHRLTDEEFRREQQRILSATPVPEFWLFGKTGSGKTSVMKYLTGARAAEIGNGFRPQTRFSQKYDFPSSDNPILRFLDTRGLGESRYDPTDDIEAFDRSTHLMIVTARVMDHALADVVAPLKIIRRANPGRPVVLALTCLHQAYPQQQHPQPDPFAESLVPEELPLDLRRSIEQQVERFEGLVDRVVPIDLTRKEEGFDVPDFGGSRLKGTLVELLPAAYRQTLLSLDEAMRPLRDLNERRATPYILGYSTMAATAAAVPLPWIDIPVVMAIQSHLTYQLAGLYGQKFDTEMAGGIAGTAGGRMLSRLLVRGTLKFIPFVGMAANAALAFAYTYAQGKLCCWYFGERRAGNVPGTEEIERVWQEQLTRANELWKSTHTAAESVPEPHPESMPGIEASPAAPQEAAP